MDKIIAFLILFLILFSGIDSNAFRLEMKKYDKLEALTLFKTMVDGDRRSAKHRTRINSYIKDIYNEFTLENDGDVHYNRDDGNPTLRSIRGYFGHRKYLAFGTHDFVRSHIDRLELVILANERIKSVISEFVNVTLNINNSEYKALRVVSKSGKIYLIFDISVLRGKLQSLFINNHIKVNNEKVKLSKSNHPVLVVFEGSTYNPLIQPRFRRVRRNASVDDIGQYFPRQRRHGSRETYTKSCRRHRWSIDMGIFELHWYIEPRYYDAGICAGTCEMPLSRTNSTNYSYIKNLWHIETGYGHTDIPRSCCVPVEYMPLWMLIVDDSGNIALKSVQKMRVKSCGCR